jgi:hypothetical protein
MAVQTKPWLRMALDGVVLFDVFMEYEDTDFQVPSNIDGEPEDFRVIRWFGTNYSASDKFVTVHRGNGSNWVDRIIPAGESFSQNAGGPVKYESDVPRWQFG